MVLTTAAFATIGRLLGLSWLVAIAIGGALSMTSTAIVIRQLTEQVEINRTHGRLALAILLFQDLAFVPLLALASRRSPAAHGGGLHARGTLRTLGRGAARARASC